MTEMRIQEYNAIESTQIDNGVIKDVPVLGTVSKNGRRYTEEALQSAAALYNNAFIYADHSSGSRKINDKLGVLRNVAFSEEKSQLRGDLHLLTRHPVFPLIQEDVDMCLGLYGLSHDAQVSGEKTTEGEVIINKINRVHSVDLVASPATTKNLREEEDIVDYELIVKEQVEKVLPDIVETAVKEAVEKAVEAAIKTKLDNTGIIDYNDDNTETPKPKFSPPVNSVEARSFLLTL